MQVIKSTKNGINYLIGTLKDKVRTVTRAFFWKIPHHTQEEEDVCLKNGRYTKNPGQPETIECGAPKSELTLDNDEFKALLSFIAENYEPFKQGVKRYIPLDADRRIFVPIARSSYKWQRIYNGRTAVERVNSRIDLSFGFEHHL
jgi:hypothetical protein